jgi:hypothetical protein
VGYPLQISTWSDQAITVFLPATYTGFVQLFVQTASGNDEINIMTTGLSFAGSIAQLASGGGWDTTLTLVNTGTATEGALLNFFANDGSPLLLPFTFPQQSATNSQVASTLNQTLNANSLPVMDSQQLSNPTAQVGSAQLLTNGSPMATSAASPFSSTLRPDRKPWCLWNRATRLPMSLRSTTLAYCTGDRRSDRQCRNVAR